MGYETKVILRTIYEAQRRCKNLEEALKIVALAANVEDVVVEQNDDEEDK